MHKIFVAMLFASATILLAIGSVHGLVPTQVAETGVIALPVLAYAAIHPTRCCTSFKGYAS